MKKKLPCSLSVNLFLLVLCLFGASKPAWGQTSIGQNFTSSPICTAAAGPDLNTCPQGVVRLSGTFGGMATGGSWNDGGAGGSFLPGANSPNTFYIPPSPNSNDSIALVFTAMGPCLPVTDTMLIFYGILPPLILTAVPDSSVFCGEELTFHIKAMDGFKNISSLQYNLNWDPAQLTFVRDTAIKIGGANPGIGVFNVADGSLTYTWFDLSGSEGEDLPDSTELLSVTLKVLPDTDTAKVSITSDPVIIEATNNQYCALTVQVNHGALPVTPIEVTCPPDSAVSLNAPPVFLNAGWPSGGVYSGTGVSGDTFDPMVAGPGVHSITYAYADTNQCSNACSYNITVTPPLELNLAQVTNESCTTGFDGAIDLNVSGGTPGYSYDWSHNGTQFPNIDPEDLSGLSAGIYTVTVTDASNCTASISVTIIELNCPEISGKLIWEVDRLTLMTGIDSATVTLSGDDNDADLTGIPGTYLLQVTSGSNFMLTPLKDEPMPNAIIGLSAADASRIQQHLTGALPLTDPYKIIAADPNGSNLVTSEDAVLVQKALLGDPLSQDFFIQKTWRFVPKAYVFPDPVQPWGFPEKINIIGINVNITDQDFIGVKTGDVIDPADTLNHPGGMAPDLAWRVQDQWLQQNEMNTAEFRAINFTELLALQFGLHFDPAKLELQGLESIPGSPLQDDNFGLIDQANGVIRSVMAHSTPKSMPNGTPAFRLRFKSLQSGMKLSEAMSLSDAILMGEAYTGDYTPGPITLVYDSIVSGAHEPLSARFRLLQNRPNPFKEVTTIGFVLPEACEAEIRIYDLNGRLLDTHKRSFASGYNEQPIHLKKQPGDEILFYELVTPFGILSRKMTVLQP